MSRTSDRGIAILSANISGLVCKNAVSSCTILFFPIRYRKHFRWILLFCYQKERNKLCDVCREHALVQHQHQNFYAEDVPRSGRPVEAIENKIMVLIEANCQTTTGETVARLNVSK